MKRPFGGVNAGTLRHRVTWQVESKSRNAIGQDCPTWGPRGTFWARVEPLTGRELFNAQQVKAVISHRITLRVVGAVAPDDRFLFEGTGRAFNVEFVARRDEMAAVLELLCSELVSQ